MIDVLKIAAGVVLGYFGFVFITAFVVVPIVRSLTLSGAI
jgi:hypothetical protein